MKINPTDPSTWPSWKITTLEGALVGMLLAPTEAEAKKSATRFTNTSQWPSYWQINRMQ